MGREYQYTVRRSGFHDYTIRGFTSRKAAEKAMKKYIQQHPTGNLGSRSKGQVTVRHKPYMVKVDYVPAIYGDMTVFIVVNRKRPNKALKVFRNNRDSQWAWTEREAKQVCARLNRKVA